MPHNKTLDRSRDSRANLAGCGFAPLYPAQTLRADWRLGQRNRYQPWLFDLMVAPTLVQLRGCCADTLAALARTVMLEVSLRAAFV